MKYILSLILILTFTLFSATYAHQAANKTNTDTTIRTADSVKKALDTLRYVDGKIFLKDYKLRAYQSTFLLMENRLSQKEFLKYGRRNLVGGLVTLGSLGCLIVAVGKSTKDPVFWNYTLTALAGEIIAIPILLSSKKHLRKAVDLWNFSQMKEQNNK